MKHYLTTLFVMLLVTLLFYVAISVAYGTWHIMQWSAIDTELMKIDKSNNGIGLPVLLWITIELFIVFVSIGYKEINK